MNKYKDESDNLLDLTTNPPLGEAVCRTAPGLYRVCREILIPDTKKREKVK